MLLDFQCNFIVKNEGESVEQNWAGSQACQHNFSPPMLRILQLLTTLHFGEIKNLYENEGKQGGIRHDHRAKPESLGRIIVVGRIQPVLLLGFENVESEADHYEKTYDCYACYVQKLVRRQLHFVKLFASDEMLTRRRVCLEFEIFVEEPLFDDKIGE